VKHRPSTPGADSTAPHQHKKRFGQHFLHDPGLIRRIVQAVAPRAGDRLVEIGPGAGAITLPLLREAGHLTVIELDRDLIPRIQAAAQGLGELDVIQADVLTVNFTTLAQGGRLRLVGNLPYNISSPILFHCLEHRCAIADMHFMLQREVVERMAAPPGNKVYGRLSVMLQLVCRVEPLFRVPPGAFTPPPKVDSAVVRLTPLPEAERPDADPRLRPAPQDPRQCPAGRAHAGADHRGRGRSEGTGRTTRPRAVRGAGAQRGGGLRASGDPSPTPQKRKPPERCPAHRRRPHPAKPQRRASWPSNPEADSLTVWRPGALLTRRFLRWAENREPARALHPSFGY